MEDLLRLERAQHKELMSTLIVDLVQATEEQPITEMASEALTHLLPGAGAVVVCSINMSEGSGSVQGAGPLRPAMAAAPARPSSFNVSVSCVGGVDCSERLAALIRSQLLDPSDGGSASVGRANRKAVSIHGSGGGQRRPHGSSAAFLLGEGVGGPISSAIGRFGPNHFDDWAAVAAQLPGMTPPAHARAWSSLVRSSHEVVAFVSVVWAAPSQKSAQAVEDVLQDDFCPALEKALWRVRSQGRVLEQERATALQQLQQRFLARMSHGALLSRRGCHLRRAPFTSPAIAPFHASSC